MAKGTTVEPLREWRLSRRLTFEQAAALVPPIDGVERVQKSTWYAWEAGKRLPGEDYMNSIYVLTHGTVRPDHFYDLPPLGPVTVAAPIAPELELAG